MSHLFSFGVHMAHLWLLVVMTWGLLVWGWDQEGETSLSVELKPETGVLDDDNDGEGTLPDPEEPHLGKGSWATSRTQEDSVEPSPRVCKSATDPSQVDSTPSPLPRSGVTPRAPASRCRTPPPLQTPPRAQRECKVESVCHLGVDWFNWYCDYFGKMSPKILNIPDLISDCTVAPEEQLLCGHFGILPVDCEAMGCCVNPTLHTCFYPMDECTVDLHFVFIIRSTYGSMPVDPTHLVIPGTKCKPAVVNSNFAIFKFKVTECGTHMYEIGLTRFYLAEVQTLVQALRLKYGIITRTDPLRFLVECRYGLAARDQQPLASVGFMVKIPSRNVPTSIYSDGLYGVQLRIATDKTFSTFLPSFPKLRYILGKPVYLQLRLFSPKPKATILVKYCLAFPRSAKNALVLVYEGCANPYDPSVAILQVSDLPQNRHQRNFEVKAFQFMDVKTKRYLDEQIHFMCSSEVCWSDEKLCEERCFDGKES
ncbi:zona pellucida sperm-binding protein 1-like isoform X2 [Syngnathus typhle]|uniref:zona pellucida sperm-binding protein 1-like isoform X2 n=1 Tax=Syngnathus typhle TaxID=161592 RepID=UPI002A6B8C29|nr:zona pellucida sperm-binding protein 1-like isoform X2 [Syngnathus typhle]